MSIYTVKVKEYTEVASNTLAFVLEKPAGFTHKAGQFADWTLADSPKELSDDNVHSFTIASAPYEEHLLFATRMRNSTFKRQLRVGTEFKLDRPQGDFILHDDPQIPAVLIAGGIGATAMRGIVLQAAHDKLGHKITLFYSNRAPQDAPFLLELAEVMGDNPNFKLVATMTKIQRGDKAWGGETGMIDKAMLDRHIDDLTLPIYYISGPPDMVSAMGHMLQEASVEASRIHTDEFSGY